MTCKRIKPFIFDSLYQKSCSIVLVEIKLKIYQQKHRRTCSLKAKTEVVAGQLLVGKIKIHVAIQLLQQPLVITLNLWIPSSMKHANQNPPPCRRNVATISTSQSYQILHLLASCHTYTDISNLGCFCEYSAVFYQLNVWHYDCNCYSQAYYNDQNYWHPAGACSMSYSLHH